MRGDILERKVAEAQEAYQKGGVLVDTCALDFSPWRQSPYQPIWNHDLDEDSVTWMQRLFSESESLLSDWTGSTIHDVYDEFKVHTDRLLYEKERIAEADTEQGRLAEEVVKKPVRLRHLVCAQSCGSSEEGLYNAYWESVKDFHNGTVSSNDRTDASLVEHAFYAAERTNEPVTILSGDKDMIQYSSLFCRATNLSPSLYNDVNIALIRHEGVHNITSKDWY